jgi:outer membrane receptor protein involved in Fe transport
MMNQKCLCAVIAAVFAATSVHAGPQPTAVQDAQHAQGATDANGQPVHRAPAATTPPAEAAADASKPTQMQTVKVTGSLIPRAQVEGPSPTISITAKDIEAKGFGSTFEALRALPVANGSVQDAQFTGGYTPGAKTVSLLGLSPAFTLTLLNGRPMNSYPLAYNGGSNITDIANIPVGLIDHIDVLTGGQSSVYGSSAIAGVINIVLKDHVEGTHLNFRMGGFDKGGGENQRLQFSSGTRWGDLDISGGLELSQQAPIYAYQRKYIDSYNDDPTGLGAVPSRTFLRQQLGDNQHYIDPGSATCAPLSYMYGGTTAYSYRSAQGLGHYCGSPNNVSYTTLDNKETDANGALFLRYHLTPQTEIYSDMLYSYSNPTYSGGSPFWNQTFYNQTSGQYETWQRIFSPEEVGLDATNQHVFTRSYNFTLGLRGPVGDSDFSYDIYYNRSQTNVTRKTHDFVANNGIDQYYLGPQLGTDASGYEIFAPNLGRLYVPFTRPLYDAVTAENRSKSSAWNQNVTATVTNSSLFELPAGPVGVAAIVQANDERFGNRSNSAIADTGFFRGQGGGTVAEGSRTARAGGMEFQIPLLKMLTANVSGRYDKYSYAGTSNGKLTYKLGLEFRPLDTLLLRGSYATAFRAPDMFNLFSAHTSGYSTSTDFYKCRMAGYNSTNYEECPQSGTSVLANSTGNTALKDITAKSFTYGFVWSTPDNALSWSVDYNAVLIKNEVATLGNDEILETEANCRLGVSENGQTPYDINSPTCQEVLGEVQRLPSTDPINPNGVQAVFTYPINVAKERQTGIQSQVDYRFSAGSLGDFIASANYYDALTHTYQEKVGDPTLNYLCCANSDEFKSRVSASLTWNKGDWSTTLFGQRDGRTWNQIGTKKNIGPWITFNGSATYRLNKMASITFTANNLFNKRPPKDSTNGGWPYYDVGDYSALGRELWMQLNLDFGAR